jgi:hypothetical protein
MLRLLLILVIGLAGPANAQSLPTVYRGPLSPNAEFETAAGIRILPGGNVVEISGSFSPAVPLNLEMALLQAPRVRTVRFESPGGQIQSAMVVAGMIRDRGLDTYVGRLCASACTLAFLGGRHRFLAPDARLGFHQASAPGVAPDRLNPQLRQAYAGSGVPSEFIDHVLLTPPSSVWFPDRSELRDAGFITGEQPAEVAVTDDPVSAVWGESMKVMRWAPDSTLLQVAAALSPLLAQLRAKSPESCWGFMHLMPIDLRTAVAPATLGAMTAALRQVHEDVSHAPAIGIDSAQRVRVLALLIGSLYPAAQTEALEALRPNGDHAAFCRSMQTMLDAALALPALSRGSALRALLSEG